MTRQQASKLEYRKKHLESRISQTRDELASLSLECSQHEKYIEVWQEEIHNIDKAFDNDIDEHLH